MWSQPRNGIDSKELSGIQKRVFNNIKDTGQKTKDEAPTKCEMSSLWGNGNPSESPSYPVKASVVFQHNMEHLE